MAQDSPDIPTALGALGLPDQRAEFLAGDVSPRSYFRIVQASGTPAILAIYPREIIPSCDLFSTTTSLLQMTGVRVPRILAQDCRHGVMLLEDLGSSSLYALAGSPWNQIEPWLELGAELTAKIGGISPEAVSGLSPPLDPELLRRELRQTWDLFLQPRALVGERQRSRRLERSLDNLCTALGERPAVVCHRDFMARNLMLVESEGLLAVLDHQDLRLGPPFYDLASLLNDSLFAPPAIEERIVARRLTKGEERAGYHAAAAQRTLKAIGTFAAFAKRGFRQHVPLIRPTLERSLRHLLQLPETFSIAEDLAADWRCFVRQDDDCAV